MLFALVTLLLLAGMLILSLDRDQVIGAFALGVSAWIGLRLIGNRLDYLRKDSPARWEKLMIGAEKRLGEISRSEDSVGKKWQDFCALIVSQFGYNAAFVAVEREGMFSAEASSGFDIRQLKQVSIDSQSELIHVIAMSGDPIELLGMSCDMGTLDSVLGEQSFRGAVPLTRGNRLGAILFVSFSSQTVNRRQNLMSFCKLAAKMLIPRDPREEQSPGLLSPVSVQSDQRGSRLLRDFFDVTSKLFTIYNQELLFETFVSNMRKLMKAEYCVIYLPGENDSGLRVGSFSGSLHAELNDYTVDVSPAVRDLLLRHPGTYTVDDLLDLTGDDRDLVHLAELGVRIITPMSIPERRMGLMCISGRSRNLPDFSIDDKETAYTVSQTVEIILENIHQFRKIEELSYTDSMTRLYNYRYFYKRLSEEILRAKRFNRFLALSIFDIDEFKVFNDNLGHQTGDDLLRQLGELLLDSVRSIDIVCRYGGEEFCVIMPESDRKSCRQLLERLRKRVMEHEFSSRFSAGKHTITLSAGGAIYPSDARRVDRLIYCADMALLEAKRSGRNRCEMYTEGIEENGEADA
jgi:diguanylate cyclase (GGDEF)-like protein